jgi:SPP1 gp7 family putative phage head morphogenesis protein
MRLGMSQNETLEEMVARVRGISTNGFADGNMALPWAQADTVVRTAVVDIANTARLETYANNSDIIYGVKWVTAHDQRVDDPCLELAGKEWTLPEDPTDYAAYEPIDHDLPFPGPIVHFNCRCTQVPVLRPLGQPSEME